MNKHSFPLAACHLRKLSLSSANLIVPMMLVCLTGMQPVAAAELPDAGSYINNWRNGRITQHTSNYLQIDNTRDADGNPYSGNSILDWVTFNIGEGGRVEFLQPSSQHTVLNRVNDPAAQPSRILGQLDANGRVYVINRNGILFGANSQINVNTLVASSLSVNINDDDFVNGAQTIGNRVNDRQAAFTCNPLPCGSVETLAGASIETGDSGQVMLIAPEVINGGNIHTHSGQAILAGATDSVYLTPSSDQSLRGFLVEVGGVGGNVENAGKVLSERGNITLAGLTLKQNGELQATTSVLENGSIRLLARDQASSVSSNSINDDNARLVIGVNKTSDPDLRRDEFYIASHTGSVELGENSTTRVVPDSNDTTELPDAQVQKASRIELTGHDITLRHNAAVTATGGEVLLHATSRPNMAAVNLNASSDGLLRSRDDSLVEMESGSFIDVSGSMNAVLPMSRNELEVQLTGNFLQDSPLQRDGVLRNQRVYVDARAGTPLGDISELQAGIAKGLSERLSSGGSVDIYSGGGVLLDSGSRINIAGGSVSYLPGSIRNTQLVAGTGDLVDISRADPNQFYTGIFGSMSRNSARWGSGSKKSWSLFSNGGGSSRYYPGYTQGRNAGSLNIQTYAASLYGDIHAGTSNSEYQRQLGALSSGGEFNLALGNTEIGRLTQSVLVSHVRQQTETSRAELESFLGQAQTDVPDWDMELLDSQINDAGLSVVRIRNDAGVNIQADADIELSPYHEDSTGFANLGIKSRSLSLDGDVTAASGVVAINTGSLVLNGSINVSGNWTNDAELAAPDRRSQVLLDGGKIQLSASNQFDFNAGAELLANSGAWQDRDGRLIGGNGGSISLKKTSENGSEMQLNGRLQAFGLARGGKLALEANRVVIAPDTTQLPGSPALLLGESLFRDDGFSDYNITSNLADLRVMQGTDLKPATRSWVLDGNARLQQSGTDMASITREQRLADYQRPAANLRLDANPRGFQSLRLEGGLYVEDGARITMDPGSELALYSETYLYMNGDLTDRGGNIRLYLETGEQANPEYRANQGIWVSGSMDVSGTFVAGAPNDENLLLGQVLDAGQIEVTAEKGYVILDENSQLNASGSLETLDVPSAFIGATPSRYQRQQLASQAGSIELSAAEGLLLKGALQARAAPADGASGGRLDVILNPASRPVDTSGSGNGTMAPRVINLTADSSDLPATPVQGQAIDDSLIGNAWIDVQRLADGGFDDVGLTARNLLRNGQNIPGAINFRGNIHLSTGKSLRLQAAEYLGNANTVNLSAPYMLLGPSNFADVPADTDIPQAGSAILDLQAGNSTGMLDLVGNSIFTGFQQLNLASAGDLRLRGYESIDDRGQDYFHRFQGSLRSSGNLLLQADQVYPASLTEFRFSLDDAAGQPALLDIQAGDGASPVLSAAGRLELNAARIHQGGVIKAPFGQIDLNGTQAIEFGAGSITSVSGEDQLVPLGATRGELQWLYPLEYLASGDTPDAIYLDSPAEKQINLTSPAIQQQAGAVLDVSGGGDLLAWEFIPGLGGSQDNLLPENSGAAFAILPASSSDYAPYDAYYWLNLVPGKDIHFGEQIYLGGTSDLAEGSYTILPARYAVLPGARLVTPVSGYTDLQPGQVFSQVDGSPVVAGRTRVVGTDFHASRWSGYRVESRERVLQRSEYLLSTASLFYRDGAARNETRLPALPEDAGEVNLFASASLSLGGELRSATGEVNRTLDDGSVETYQGRGSQLNIAGDVIHVVNSFSGTDGVIELLDQDLNRLGADSVFLGGTRQRTDAGTLLAVTATDVTLESGASLEVPDIILASDEKVTVASGARVIAQGDAGLQDSHLVIGADGNGDGALLRVSAADQVSIERRQTGLGQVVDGDGNPVKLQGQPVPHTPAGELDIQAGAVLVADRSMALDATESSQINGELNISQGSLNIGAQRISLGDVSGAASPQDLGLVFSADDLAHINATELVLTSRTSVDLYGSLDLAFNQLSIEAASLDGYQAANESARLSLHQLRLGNPSPGSTSLRSAPTGQGKLEVNADGVQFSAAPLLSGDTNGDGITDGGFHVRGFDQVALHAGQQISASGKGQVDFNQATQVDMDTPLVSAASGSQYRFNASHAALQILHNQAVSAGTESLGASLFFQAEAIRHEGRIELPSGSLSLQALSGDVELGAASVINLSGIQRQFADRLVYTDGGDLSLVSEQGNVVVSGDNTGSALLNVSAGGGQGNAGSIRLSAAQGEVQLQGQMLAAHGADASGGRFQMDVQQLNNFAALNSQLNQQGFSEKRHIRTRTGNLVLADTDSSAGAAEIVAHDVALVADNGEVVIQGQIDASGESGGQVGLAGASRVSLAASAAIDARATSDQGDGGEINLSVCGNLAIGANCNGGISLAAGSVLSLGGGNGGKHGSLNLYAPMNAAADDVAISEFAGTINQAREINLWGMAAYAINSSNNPGDTDTFNPTLLGSLADTASPLGRGNQFADQAGTILSRLGITDTNIHVMPGFEFRSDGPVSVGTAIDFSQYRFGSNNEPGLLRLRSQADLAISATLEDGFVATPNPFNPNQTYDLLRNDRSWSMEFIAGADLNSASAGQTSNNGSFHLIDTSPGDSNFTSLRTGSGFLQVLAADNIVMDTDTAIYSAGNRSGTRGSFDQNIPGFGSAMEAFLIPGMEFPDQNSGGNVNLVAGNSINAAPSSLLISDWLQRYTVDSSTAKSFGFSDGRLPNAWGIAFDLFHQGVGALGGGNVTVQAGGDINGLSVSIPTVGKQVGNHGFDPATFQFTPGESQLQLNGRGNIDVTSGGDINRALFYAGSGRVDVQATGAIGLPQPGLSTSEKDSGVYLVAGDTRANISAGGDVYFQGMANATLMPFSTDNLGAYNSYFSSYSGDSSVSVASLGGNIVLRNSFGTGSAYFAKISNRPIENGAANALGSLYGANVQMIAVDGDIQLENSMTLWPAAGGNLELLADKNIATINQDTLIRIYMPDVDPATVAGILDPAEVYKPSGSRVAFNTSLDPVNEVHAISPLHLHDTQDVSIVTNQGDIRSETDDQFLQLILSKPAQINAGRDIRNVSLINQNLDVADITLLSAGRDLRYLNSILSRSSASKYGEIRVAGPGEVQVLAGRNIDLGDQKGIQTIGSIRNPALDDNGARLLVMAGLGNQGMDLDNFYQQYITADSEYAQTLLNFMAVQGLVTDDFHLASSAFMQLDASHRQAFLTDVLFNEIRESGKRASQEQANPDAFDALLGYRQAYAAIATLFPGSDGSSASNKEITFPTTNPVYAGDISLFASVIKTSDGGDLQILAPGGNLNVGLTVKQDSSQDLGILTKGAGDINIMTYNDVSVNESRVQALDGGNILLWSTVGDIDAGRGAKSALFIPPPRTVIDNDGNIKLIFDAAVQGSGIRTAAFSPGVDPGSVFLFAPAGVVDAGDAGIDAGGGLFIGATQVLNATQISSGGPSVGVPTGDSTGLGVNLSLDSNSSASAAAEQTALVAQDASDQFGAGSIAILRVEVESLDEENIGNHTGEGKQKDKDRNKG